MKKTNIVVILFLLSGIWTVIKAQKNIEVLSPNGMLQIDIKVGKQITYSLKLKNDTILYPSDISMQLIDMKCFGVDSKLNKVLRNKVSQKIASPFYKRSEIVDNYNEVTLIFKENFNLIFRAYNDGMAYRFVSTGNNDFIVRNEEASFELGKDSKAYIPYVRSNLEKNEDQFSNSFENVYAYQPVSQWVKGSIAFLPLVVERAGVKKICITEADLENYPGMYLYNPTHSTCLKSCFATYPKTIKQGGYKDFQLLVTERETYIAKCKAKTNFPWRVVIVSSEDKELAGSDMVYKLASPSRIKDISWIKPGQSAWEWWNDWNLFNVDFKAGINTQTYKHYIDFASKYKMKYILMDEGWSVKGQFDLLKVVLEINLKELVDYATKKNVGIILWAGYYPFDKDMENTCKHYSQMGIKGFKVDFINRDDQPAVNFHYRCAETAAKYNLLIDFHGTYKPTGLNRTYPNVINFEGVYGLEQLKFSSRSNDQVTYEVTIPFIRQVAGPMDYTQGAMRNATKENFRTIYSEPMSQGTRCRQIAEYIVFDSPLAMLCDNPSCYEKDIDCTRFITSIPTVWERTIPLTGKIGEYIAIARKSGSDWYIGCMTNWNERTLELDLSFLGEGNFKAEIFKDGINAYKKASDYKKEIIQIGVDKKLKIDMASGGGFAMRIYPIRG